MKKICFTIAALFTIVTLQADTLPQPKEHIAIKQPGNSAVTFDLQSTPKEMLPVVVETKMLTADDNQAVIYEVTVKAKDETIYFNFGAELSSGFSSDDCEYYMPGFWYRRNLRSPREAPRSTLRRAGTFVKTACRHRLSVFSTSKQVKDGAC